ncbi:hypothetical protein ELQ88_26895 [Pseudomonas sp. MPC6]|nr:hypothetical protein ELQ88_26895 [Pseudomonas sp. MPC6]
MDLVGAGLPGKGACLTHRIAWFASKPAPTGFCADLVGAGLPANREINADLSGTPATRPDD